MDAAPFLAEVGRHLNAVCLEAVLIGNAAAALQGAPVTTVDFEFLFRKTPGNLAVLPILEKALEEAGKPSRASRRRAPRE
ncbi:MAG: hypothetical protein U0Q55_21100 [Vicinamibacterales bacterium]